ncbi:MAG: nucleotide exchange factor GrpE [Ochrobactrum anthropi]|uniref:Protein GrpE n=1 Tax=Brucella anthropi TaxID=529 RepID=A0A8I0N8Y5_BRUAN|nr:nucleotide exchange factor GrpE [Brucella anthropi]MBE0562762.1 nucleotide exchange factor GrpE [Brucella anthropi]
MADDVQKNPEETQAADAPEMEDDGGIPMPSGDDALAAEATGPQAAPADVPARLAELEADAADLRDKLLRALAETENVRRRGQRDREEASKYAISGFAREMVVVADNLRRALEHVAPDARQKDELLESLAAGVEMTERAMLAAFERFGIRPIEALGQKFDHNLHEAMFEVEDPSQPAGTVVHEMEKGYVLDDRLLRPARVGVAKGGPRQTNGGTEAAPSPDAKAAEKEHRAAYEKQTDAQGETAGSKGAKFDEKL